MILRLRRRSGGFFGRWVARGRVARRPGALLGILLIGGVEADRVVGQETPVTLEDVSREVEPWRDQLQRLTDIAVRIRDLIERELELQEKLTRSIAAGELEAVRDTLVHLRPAWSETLGGGGGVRQALARFDPRRAGRVRDGDEGVLFLASAFAERREKALFSLRSGALRGQIDHLLRADGPVRQLDTALDALGAIASPGPSDETLGMLEVSFESSILNLDGVLRELLPALRRESAEVPIELRRTLRTEEEALESVSHVLHAMGARAYHRIGRLLEGIVVGEASEEALRVVSAAYPQIDFSSLTIRRTPSFLKGVLYEIGPRRFLLVDGNSVHEFLGTQRDVRTVARWQKLLRDRVDPAAVALECSLKSGPLDDRARKVGETVSRFHRLLRRPWSLLAAYLQAAYGAEPVELDRRLRTVKEMSTWQHDRIVAALILDSAGPGRELMEVQDLLLQNLLVEVETNRNDSADVQPWARANDGGRVALRRFGAIHSGLVPVVPGSTSYLFVGGTMPHDDSSGTGVGVPLRQKLRTLRPPPAVIHVRLDSLLQPDSIRSDLSAGGVVGVGLRSPAAPLRLDIDRLLEMNRQGGDG